MGKEMVTFGNIEVEKHTFHTLKNPISICDINVDRTVIPNKVLFGKNAFKYFIGYENDDEKLMLLCIMLPKMSAYKRNFDETKYMFFI